VFRGITNLIPYNVFFDFGASNNASDPLFDFFVIDLCPLFNQKISLFIPQFSGFGQFFLKSLRDLVIFTAKIN